MKTTYRELSREDAEKIIEESPKGSLVTISRDYSGLDLWTVTIMENEKYTK